jgi:hypothetical protein
MKAGAMPNSKQGNGFFVMPASGGGAAVSVDDARFSVMEQNAMLMSMGPRESYEQSALANNRFVAGDKFFNYQQFGALRDGGGVDLFSSAYFGILFATAHSSIVYSVLRYCMRPTLMHSLNLERSESSVVIECLLSIPTTLSFFIGLVSDMFPICGYRRKSYMIAGALVSFCTTLAMAIISACINVDALTEAERDNYISCYMALIMVTTFGTMMSKIGTDSRIIELSQREPLTTRGKLQINYLVFRSIIEWIGLWLTYGLTQYDAETSNYRLVLDSFWMYALLALLSLLPVYFVLRNCTEPSVEQAAADALAAVAAGDESAAPGAATGGADRLRAFFRMCQQRAVWQIVLFLCILLATTRFYFGSASKLFTKLADLDANVTLRDNALKYIATIGALVWWKLSWSNSSWRRCVCLGIAVTVTLETLRALLMLYVPSIRGQAFYDTIGCLMGFTDGIITIFSFIPATEIAENGSEGATIGMLLSFRSIIAIAMRTLGEQWMADAAPVASADDTGRLCLLLLISYVVHGLGALSVLLLPRQKLDAQQMRVYGGYSSFMCGVIWLIFLVVFVYSMAINLRAVIDMANGTS